MSGEKINLIFDCDGTLTDSYGAITDKVCRLFLRHDLVCDPEDIRRRSLYSTVSQCVAEVAQENGLDPAALLAEIPDVKEDTDLITLYDHAEELVRDERFRCFVYTHRGQSCGKVFARLGIADAFTEIVDSTYGFRRKPDPQGIDYLVEKYRLDKSRTYYVGDRIIDIECGINAGVGTIFFNSSGLDIDCSKADYAVLNLGEISLKVGNQN